MCCPIYFIVQNLNSLSKKLFIFHFQCILMQVTIVIPWIFNLVMLPKELVLQPHTRGVSKSINIPVIMKIWLRKIILVKSSNLSNSNQIYIFFFCFRSGCTQYHFGSSATNYVQSFNYNSGAGKHLADQTQVICVRYY